MRAMNKQMKLPQIQKIMQDFERQSEMLDMKTEMMEDAIDDAMEGEDDEEEAWVPVAFFGCFSYPWLSWSFTSKYMIRQ